MPPLLLNVHQTGESAGKPYAQILIAGFKPPLAPQKLPAMWRQYSLAPIHASSAISASDATVTRSRRPPLWSETFRASKWSDSRLAMLAVRHERKRYQTEHGQDETGRLGHRNGEFLAQAVEP